MASRPLMILGLGARTPIGASAEATGTAMRAAISGLRSSSVLASQTGSRFTVAQDPFLPAELPADRRLSELLISAADEALAPLTNKPEISIDLLVSLPEERPGIDSRTCTRAMDRLRHHLAPLFHLGDVETLRIGRSGGLVAFESAVQRAQKSAGHFLLVLGADTYLSRETLDSLDRAGKLRTLGRTWGFTPGEASAACLLASQAEAERSGLSPLGRMLDVSTKIEHKLPEKGAVCLGEGLTAATRTVVNALPVSEKVAHVYTDLNGVRHAVDEVGFTLTRMADRLVGPSCLLTPAERWGEVGAATGPLFTVLAVTAARRGKAAGPYSLLFTSGPGAERGAALLHVPVANRDEATF